MIKYYFKNKFLFTLICMGVMASTLRADDNSEHLTTSSTESSSAQSDQKQIDAAKTKAAQEAQKLTALEAERKKQIDALMACAQSCAQFIMTRSLTPKNPGEALFWLQSFMELARKAAQIPHIPITSYKLSRSVKLNTQLIAALQEAHRSNFTSLADLDGLEQALKTIEKDIANPKTTKVSLALLLSTFTDNQQSIATLTKKIHVSAVTWYNALYRSCVSLNQRFAITQTLVTVAAITAISAAVLFALPHQYQPGPDNKQNDSWLESIQRRMHESTIGQLIQDAGDHNSKTYNRYMGLNATVASLGVLHQLGLFAKLQEMWSNIDARLIGATPINHQTVQYINTDFTLEDKMFDSVRHLLDPFYQILTFLQNPDLYIHSGQKIPKCVLLAGPPGSGKTHSALAFAGSIQKLYAEQGRPEKVGFIVMEPFEQIEDKIKEAKAHAPCVLFIDELHLHNNGLQTSNGMWLSKMLTEIDMIDKTDDPMRQVFIVTATNRPDLLASALLRAGRFGPESRINFTIPDYGQRVSVITALCEATFIKLSHTEIEHLAHLTQDCAFSSINKFIERAARDAKVLNTEAKYSHVYNAFNNVIRGIHDRISITELEKTIIATHMAGAAVAHILLESHVMLDAITLKMQSPKIIEGHDFLQKMENVDENLQHKMQKYGALFSFNAYEHVYVGLNDRFVNAKLHLAGNTAQQVILGIESDYRVDERQKAYESIVSVLLRGLKIETLSKDAQNNLKDEARTILDRCEKEVKELLGQNRDAIIRIAEELKRKAFLTVDEIKALMVPQETTV